MPLFTLLPGTIDDMIARLEAVQTELRERILIAAGEVGQQIVEQLQASAPVGEGGGGEPAGDDAPGPLSESFEMRQDGATVSVVTTQANKLGYVRYGTGIYGPTGSRIVPRTASALAFTWHGQLMIRRSVAGQKPNDFVTPALADADEIMVEHMTEAVSEVMIQLG